MLESHSKSPDDYSILMFRHHHKTMRVRTPTRANYVRLMIASARLASSMRKSNP